MTAYEPERGQHDEEFELGEGFRRHRSILVESHCDSHCHPDPAGLAPPRFAHPEHARMKRPLVFVAAGLLLAAGISIAALVRPWPRRTRVVDTRNCPPGRRVMVSPTIGAPCIGSQPNIPACVPIAVT